MNIKTPSESRLCQVCGKDASQADLIAASSVRPVVVNLITKDYPEWSAEGFICVDDLNRFRYDYVRSLIETERGELSDLEKAVIESLASQEILSRTGMALARVVSINRWVFCLTVNTGTVAFATVFSATDPNLSRFNPP